MIVNTYDDARLLTIRSDKLWLLGEVTPCHVMNLQCILENRIPQPRFSASFAALSTSRMASFMTSVPALQLRSITPSRDIIVCARYHLLFQSSTFLGRGGPVSSYEYSLPVPSRAPTQPPDNLLDAYCAAEAGYDDIGRRGGGGRGGFSVWSLDAGWDEVDAVDDA